MAFDGFFTLIDDRERKVLWLFLLALLHDYGVGELFVFIIQQSAKIRKRWSDDCLGCRDGKGTWNGSAWSCTNRIGYNPTLFIPTL